MRRFLIRVLVLLVPHICFPASISLAQDMSPIPLLSSVITQLQEGRPDSTMFGDQLLRTIGEQTHNTGRYDVLAALGPVTQINLAQSQDYPNGRLYSLQAQHSNGLSVWTLGINSISRRVEYANFNVVTAAQSQVLAQSPTVVDRPRNTVAPSAGCKIYPSLCN
jgi:hypothetical protein